jgi:hypothetical protein
MRTTTRKTTPLGELIAAAFDGAAAFAEGPLEVSRLGTLALLGLLQRGQARPEVRLRREQLRAAGS